MGVLDTLLAELEAQEGRRPPVSQWQPERETAVDIRIDREGRWFHEGGEIKRPAMVRLFASVLRREGEAYYLVTPVEKARLRVDDAPFVAHLVSVEGEGDAQRVMLRTNVDDLVLVGPDHPLRVTATEAGPRPYVTVRDNLEARLDRNAFYQLVDYAVPGPDGARHGVWSDGAFFPLEA